jgi:hypothetical protein
MVASAAWAVAEDAAINSNTRHFVLEIIGCAPFGYLSSFTPSNPPGA